MVPRSSTRRVRGPVRPAGFLALVALVVAACSPSTPQVEMTSTTGDGTGEAEDPASSEVASGEGEPTTVPSTEPTTTLPEDPTERWRFQLAETGAELPGGGTEVFPDRRIVALYGNPLTTRLGVLGEYDPAGALDLLSGFADHYEAAPVAPPPTTAPPSTAPPTTAPAATTPPTTATSTAAPPSTASPTTASPMTASPTTASPSTAPPTTAPPTTEPAPVAPIPVVPAFELIATVASGEAGGDGDYSRELSVDQLRPWVDAATAAGAFVLLDLQPGRTDFLTQARRYEEFLRQPNVGLALDPEWRLEADEVHLEQIGSVDAAEVNQVVDYLVELVRAEVLPQKILVLHQFRVDMIPDRELVRTPPELAVVVHVDGQGPLATKYATFETMLNAPTGPDQTLWWGWKNFYDEDTPVATPEQVNQVVPLPVVITYQ